MPTIQFPTVGTGGRPIAVTAIASPGTLIHTCHATLKDEVWLWLSNNSSAAVDVVIQIGTVADGYVAINRSLAVGKGLSLEIPGARFSSSTLIRVYASVASVVTALCNINRTDA